MLNVAGVSIPKSKFNVKVRFAKAAFNPKPQAGARPIWLWLSTNQRLPSGPAAMP
jgi:hypothetical protein